MPPEVWPTAGEFAGVNSWRVDGNCGELEPGLVEARSGVTPPAAR